MICISGMASSEKDQMAGVMPAIFYAEYQNFG